MASDRFKKFDDATKPRKSLKAMVKGTLPLPKVAPILSSHTGSDLEDENSRLSSAFETTDFTFEFSPDPVLFLNETGQIISANPAAMKFLRLEPLSDQNSNFMDFVSGADIGGDLKNWIETAGKTVSPPSEKRVFRKQVDLIRANAENVPVEIAIVQNSARPLIVYIRDISQYEGKLNCKTDALRDLKSRDHLKSRFMAAMSHEIRTPFNAVSGLLDLLAETELDENQRSLVTTGQEATTALLQITDDLLDYTKISTGHYVLAQHPFQARTVFDSIFKLFEPAARQKGLDLILDVDDVGCVYLLGDLPRIHQILNNFVSNAIKFTETGSVTLWAGTRLLVDGKIELTCVVKDTGIGIAMDDQSSLFGEFYRVEDGDLQTHKGTGLGLAISKTLVRLMDGLVGVNSRTGQGSNFWISVPLESVEATQITPPKDLQKTSKTILEKGMNIVKRDESIYGVQVLLADDYKTNQMIITRQLEELGANVTVVNNGEEALQVLEASKFDIALMDISMPIMGGIETTERIRALKSDIARLPILALTAIASDEDRAAYIAAGMTDVMTKPTTQPALQHMISKALNVTKSPNITQLKPPRRAVSLFDNVILDSIFTGLEASDVSALTGQFSTDLLRCINNLEQALGQSDLDAIQRTSHTLKGLAATFGCIELSKFAELTNYNAIKGSVEGTEKNGQSSVKMGRDAIEQVQISFSPYQIRA